MTRNFQEIGGVKHSAFRRARALTSPAGRAAEQQFMVEGEGMVAQALDAGAALVDVFAVAGASLDPALTSRLRESEAALYTVSRGLMTKLLGTAYDTAVTVIAAVRMRLPDLTSLLARPGPLLVCESIQDPRNVGVLLRTAEAGGARGALLTSDCAEPFSRAAVRSSTGSILRVPMTLTDDLRGDLSRLREAGLRIIATSAHGATPADRARLNADCAIIVGNESEGVSAALREAADEVVAIAVAGGASSFNVTVAAGILLYEAGRGLPVRL